MLSYQVGVLSMLKPLRGHPAVEEWPLGCVDHAVTRLIPTEHSAFWSILSLLLASLPTRSPMRTSYRFARTSARHTLGK